MRGHRYRFVAQVTHRGELSKPFPLGGIRVEDILEAPEARDDARPDEAGARMPVGDVIAHLETLDERILAELEKARRQAGTVDKSRSACSRTCDKTALSPRSFAMFAIQGSRSAGSELTTRGIGLEISTRWS